MHNDPLGWLQTHGNARHREGFVMHRLSNQLLMFPIKHLILFYIWNFNSASCKPAGHDIISTLNMNMLHTHSRVDSLQYAATCC